MNIQSLLQGLNFTAPSWDVFFIIFFVIAIFLYGLSIGRNKLVLIITSTYFSIVLLSYFPFMDDLIKIVRIGEPSMIKIGLFLALAFVIFILISRSVAKSSLRHSKKTDKSWSQILIFSFLEIGIVTSIVISFMPEDNLANLSLLTKQLFSSALSRFLWLLAPILIMAMIRRKKKED